MTYTPAGLIPHRPPFLLVDEIIEMDPGRAGKGLWTPRPDWDIFEGHFPGNPILPGVLQVEAIAQLVGCVCAAAPVSDEQSAGPYLFGKVRQAKFRRPIQPGEECEIFAEVLDATDVAIEAAGKIVVGGKVACVAAIVCVQAA